MKPLIRAEDILQMDIEELRAGVKRLRDLSNPLLTWDDNSSDRENRERIAFDVDWLNLRVKRMKQ